MKKVIILILIYLFPIILNAEIDNFSYLDIYKKYTILINASTLFGPGGNFQNAGKILNTKEISHSSLEYYQIYALYINSIYGKDEAFKYIDSLEYIGSINSIENIYSKGIVSTFTKNVHDAEKYIDKLNNTKGAEFYKLKLAYIYNLYIYHNTWFEQYSRTDKIDTIINNNKLNKEDLFFLNLIKLDIKHYLREGFDFENHFDNAIQFIELCKNNIDLIDENNLYVYFYQIQQLNIDVNSPKKFNPQQNIEIEDLISSINAKIYLKQRSNNRSTVYAFIKLLSNSKQPTIIDSLEKIAITHSIIPETAFEENIVKYMLYTATYSEPPIISNKFSILKSNIFSTNFHNTLEQNISNDSLLNILDYEFTNLYCYKNLNQEIEFYNLSNYLEKNLYQLNKNQIMYLIGYCCLLNESNIENYKLSPNNHSLFCLDYMYAQDNSIFNTNSNFDLRVKFLEKNPYYLLDEYLTLNNELVDIKKVKTLHEFYTKLQNKYPGSTAILKNKIYLLYEYYRSINEGNTIAADNGETLEMLKTIIQLLSLNQSEGAYYNEDTKLTKTLCANNEVNYRYDNERGTFFDFFNRLNDNQKNEFNSEINLAISKFPENVNLRRLKMLFIETNHFRFNEKYTTDNYAFYLESLNYFTHTCQKFSSFISLDTTLMLKLIEEKRIEKYASTYDWNIIPYLFYFNQLDKASTIIKKHFENYPESIASSSIEIYNQIPKYTKDHICLSIFSKLTTEIPENILFRIYFAAYQLIVGNINESKTILNDIASNKSISKYFNNNSYTHIEVKDQLKELFKYNSDFIKESDQEDFMNNFEKIYEDIIYGKD